MPITLVRLETKIVEKKMYQNKNRIIIKYINRNTYDKA